MNPNNYYSLIIGQYEPAALNESVPDFAYNPLNLSGQLYTPVIDKEWIRDHKAPVWPDNKKFAVCLTHDVDAVSNLDLKQNIRQIIKLLKNPSRRAIGGTLRRILEYKLNALKGLFGQSDHLCKFEAWMDLEAKHGARSTFFFAPEDVKRVHYSDCMYKYDQSINYRGANISIADLMRKMDNQGWEIGLHPSWHTHADIDELAYQKKQVEQVIKHPINSVRQHFLKFDSQNTHRIQSEAGFKYDSTLGYNDNPGFRRGSSYLFKCYDQQADQTLPLLQVPLIIQDGALLDPTKGLRLDAAKAVEYIMLMMNEVKEVGGVLTLSWHPHTFNRPLYFDVYRRVLELLEKEHPWFATVNEVGDWWQKYIKLDLTNFTKNLSSR